MEAGKKYDTGKNQLGLVMQGLALPLWHIGRILTYGCQKYGANTWQNLENPTERYMDAFYRHMNAWHRGELRDEESGELHLAHAAVNILFLFFFELKKEGN